MKVYQNIKTNETVPLDEAEEYAQDKLGIELKPRGKYGTISFEQQEFLTVFTEWWFSGDWILTEIKEDEYLEDDLEFLEKQDRIYEDEVDGRLGIA